MLSTVSMATLTLTLNCRDDSEDILENFQLEETILGSRNEKFDYIISKIGVDLDMIGFGDKIIITLYGCSKVVLQRQ